MLIYRSRNLLILCLFLCGFCGLRFKNSIKHESAEGSSLMLFDWVHLAMATDGKNIDDLLGLIKNFLLMRQFPLHIHVVALIESQNRLRENILTWNIHPSTFRLSLYNYSLCAPFAAPFQSWITETRYLGSICKLGLPHIVSQNVRYLLLIDTDMVRKFCLVNQFLMF